MKIGLFIPCYVEQFYPTAAIATLNLLKKLGMEVVYPLDQTCCGQPMANSGCENYGKDTSALFMKNFSGFEYVVSPSGSCVLHVKEHVLNHNGGGPKIFELCEFLTDVLKITDLDASFPYRVGLHESCHGLRGLRLGSASELVEEKYSKPGSLLVKVKGIELVPLNRPDECCGFGGTFAVSEEAVSVRMGIDRIDDHITHGAEVITATDLSCLMHMEGLLKRQNSKVKIKHIAEILNAKEVRSTKSEAGS